MSKNLTLLIIVPLLWRGNTDQNRKLEKPPLAPVAMVTENYLF